ncbi:Lrp/AsnC family transcriptional regulator [Candidatus Thioglobus sp.]|nr:Lrp/AsnC family transcriptional regulator [Candidatus Thioglobus sp.]
MNKLDSFDYKILKIVQENNKITSQQLAKEVGLSSSACQRRLNSMRKTGIIERDISVLDRNQLDRKITIIVQILSDIEGTAPDIQFKKTMFDAPEVMQCYYVTGDYDYVLMATFKEMGDYEDFTKKYFLENPNIKRFSSMVVMNKVKENLSIPVD